MINNQLAPRRGIIMSKHVLLASINIITGEGMTHLRYYDNFKWSVIRQLNGGVYGYHELSLLEVSDMFPRFAEIFGQLKYNPTMDRAVFMIGVDGMVHRM